MFCTIRLPVLVFALYPDSMPLLKALIPSILCSITHDIPVWNAPGMNTVHDSSTSWPGRAMTIPGPSWAVTVK